MTIATTVSRIDYTANGATTVFPVPFVFFGADELRVIEREIATGAEATLARGSRYSVTGGDGTTGSVTALAAPLSGYQWTILRDTDALQTIDYQANDAFPAESHERALDRVTALVQERDRDGDRALRVPATDPGTGLELPPNKVRAGRLLAFDDNGVPIALPYTTDGEFLIGDWSLAQVTASGSSVALTLAEHLGYVANVTTFGSNVGEGDAAADTAAYQAAVATGKSVYFPPGTYWINAGASAVAHGQKIFGQGQRQTTIVIVGSFNFFSVTSRWYNCGIGGIYFTGYAETTQQCTGGWLAHLDDCVRFVVHDVESDYLYNGFYARDTFQVYLNNVTMGFFQGTRGVHLDGPDNARRVDLFWPHQVIMFADPTNSNWIGLEADGAVYSIRAQAVYFNLAKNGIWFRNSYGVATPTSTHRFVDFGCEYPLNDGVVIDAGSDMTFDHIYLIGLGAGVPYSGFKIGAGVAADAIQIGGHGKAVGFGRYGIETATIQRVGGMDLRANTLGPITISGSGILAPRFDLTGATGSRSGKGMALDSAGNAIFVGASSTYIVWDVPNSKWTVSIGGNEILRLTTVDYSRIFGSVQVGNAGAFIGFGGTVPIAKPTITGSRANTEQALKDLLAKLAALGLVTDSTTI